LAQRTTTLQGTSDYTVTMETLVRLFSTAAAQTS